MRWICVIVAGIALCALPSGWTQTKEIQDKIDKALEAERAKEAKLEELLQQALKHNPDIRLAEAKLHESEAQLAKVRLEVLQKVVLAHQHIKIAEATLAAATARWQRIKSLFADPKAAFGEDLRAAEAEMQKYKAELALARAALPVLIGQTPLEARTFETAAASAEFVRRTYLDLLGRLPTVAETGAALKDSPEKLLDRLLASPEAKEAWTRLWDKEGKAILPEDQAVKLRKFLDTKLTPDFNDVRPAEILQYLREATKGVNILVQCDLDDAPTKLTLMEAIPVGALLQWFEDRYPVRFVLRDYGIVVAQRDRVPPGATSVLHFWKTAKEEKKPVK